MLIIPQYEPHTPTVSPDGKKLIFSSTWGPQQAEVQTFVLNLLGKVP